MADAVCNGVRLYYETFGDGEPVSKLDHALDQRFLAGQ
jgi:hypothetical protein